MRQRTPIGLTVLAILLAACQSSLGDQDTLLVSRNSGPPNPEAGACYSKTTSPAVIETVTQQVLVRAATYDDLGGLLVPAAYRTESLQKIVTPRVDSWFQTPCRVVMNMEFVASLQRALNVRGLYYGRITGEMDLRTRRAIRRYQMPDGPQSDTLSLANARKLGLVAYDRAPKP